MSAAGVLSLLCGTGNLVRIWCVFRQYEIQYAKWRMNSYIYNYFTISPMHLSTRRPDSAVGIATATDGRSWDRIIVWAKFSVSIQTGSVIHPASCTMGNRSLPEVKQPSRGAEHPPLLVSKLWIDWRYTSSSHARKALLWGDLYLYLHLIISCAKITHW